ncbi:MAG: class I SAM-dependent methyltransferase [Clostridia bacterium]|jgi:tRNA G37 N-methylase Trm5|nr:class I SAM-dependent methyltransferase [Clostridia bacterium]MDD4572358.1 class I SAM-dependent methyltransferase [Clostridia bacterium]
MKNSLGAVQIAHEFISRHVKQGDLCIDATAGRGNDTLLLCRLVGDTGKVIAFDIQKEALESTEELLHQNGLASIGKLVLDSHINMDNYAKINSVSCITFNLGWLPGGNHKISTEPETSIQAIDKGLSLLCKHGIISICIYYGKDSGFAEKDAVLTYLKRLDSKKYTVIVSEFVNRPNCPPLAVSVIKN